MSVQGFTVWVTGPDPTAVGDVVDSLVGSLTARQLAVETIDAGPVILQDVFHIRVGEDTLDEVKERGRDLEGRVLSQAVQLCLNDQLVVKDRKVMFRPGRFPGVAGGSA